MYLMGYWIIMCIYNVFNGLLGHYVYIMYSMDYWVIMCIYNVFNGLLGHYVYI